MAHSLILPILRRLLQLPPDVNLELRIRDCQVVLRDVLIKTGPLRELLEGSSAAESVQFLPLGVQGGSVGEVTISWSWRGLLVEPFRVTVRRLDIQIGHFAVTGLLGSSHTAPSIANSSSNINSSSNANSSTAAAAAATTTTTTRTASSSASVSASASPTPAKTSSRGSSRFLQRVLQTLEVTVSDVKGALCCEDVGTGEFRFDEFSARPVGNEEVITLHGLHGTLRDASGQGVGGTTAPLEPDVRVVRKGGRSLEDLLGLSVALAFNAPSASFSEAGIQCGLSLLRFLDKLRDESDSCRLSAGSLPVPTTNGSHPLVPSSASAATGADTVVERKTWGAWFWNKFSGSPEPEVPETSAQQTYPEDMTADDRAALEQEAWEVVSPVVESACELSIQVTNGSLLLFERSQFLATAGVQFRFSPKASEWRGTLQIDDCVLKEKAREGEGVTEVQLLAFPGSLKKLPSITFHGPVDLTRFELNIAPLSITLAPEAANIFLALAAMAEKVLEGAHCLEHQPEVRLQIGTLTAHLPGDSSVFFRLASLDGSTGPKGGTSAPHMDVRFGNFELRTEAEVVVCLSNLQLQISQDLASVSTTDCVELKIAMENLIRLQKLRSALHQWAFRCAAQLDFGSLASTSTTAWSVPDWLITIADVNGLEGGVQIVAKGRAQGLDGKEGSGILSIRVDSDLVLPDTAVKWDGKMLSSPRVAFSLEAERLRMWGVLFEAIQSMQPADAVGPQPMSQQSPAKPPPPIKIDSLSLQVLCPMGLHVSLAGEDFRLEDSILTVRKLESQLHSQAGAAHIALDGRLRVLLEPQLVEVEGSFAIDDLTEDTRAFDCPVVRATASWCEEAYPTIAANAARPSASAAASAKASPPLPSSSSALLNAAASSSSSSSTKSVPHWRLEVSFPALLDLQASDRFSSWMHESILSLVEVSREAGLIATVFRSRPYGLHVKKGQITAVAGAARALGLRPGGRIVAVGSSRRNSVDLASVQLPVVILSTPPPPEVCCDWHVGPFQLRSRRMSSKGSTALESKVSFGAQTQENWGPGLLEDLTTDLAELYMKALVRQAPQVLSALQGDFVEGARTSFNAAMSSVNMALRQTQAELGRLGGPVDNFDDLGRFPAEAIDWYAPRPRRKDRQVVSSLGQFVAQGVQSMQEAMDARQGAQPSRSSNASNASSSQSPPLPAPPTSSSSAATVSPQRQRAGPYPTASGNWRDDAVASGAQVVNTGLQVLGGFGQLVNQAVQNAQDPSRRQQRQSQQQQRPGQDCKQQ